MVPYHSLPSHYKKKVLICCCTVKPVNDTVQFECRMFAHLIKGFYCFPLGKILYNTFPRASTSRTVRQSVLLELAAYLAALVHYCT